MVLILSLSVAAAAVDWAVWRRCRRRRLAVLLPLWAADCAPLVVSAVTWLAGDNTQPYCDASMWITLAWMLTVLPKSVILVAMLVSRRRGMVVAAAVCAAAMVLTLVYGTLCGRKDITVTRVEIHSPHLPESFDGFRAAVFSDLHTGALVDAEKETRRLVDTINSLDADAVFFCGDLVNIRHSELTPSVMDILGQIRSTYGTFSVTGNHDNGFYVADTAALPMNVSRRLLLEKVRRMGWHPADGTSIILHRGGDSISVTGIPFFDELNEIRHSRRIPQFDLTEFYAGVDTASFNITLAHMPQMWPQIRATGHGDLTLSGHVHSMQLKFRIFGRAFSPARLLYRHWSGLYADDSGGRIYVNDGIGCSGIPARIGARPEITLITLRR